MRCLRRKLLNDVFQILKHWQFKEWHIFYSPLNLNLSTLNWKGFWLLFSNGNHVKSVLLQFTSSTEPKLSDEFAKMISSATYLKTILKWNCLNKANRSDQSEKTRFLCLLNAFKMKGDCSVGWSGKFLGSQASLNSLNINDTLNKDNYPKIPSTGIGGCVS